MMQDLVEATHITITKAV